MGSFHFYRRKEIFPGVRVNISRSGPSLTFGGAGLHLTVGPRGIRRTIGIPGTGFYYTSSSGYHSGIHTGYRGPTEPGLKLHHLVWTWFFLWLVLLFANQTQLSADVLVYGLLAVLIGWPLYKRYKRLHKLPSLRPERTP
jgi:hypothetical protein